VYFQHAARALSFGANFIFTCNALVSKSGFDYSLGMRVACVLVSFVALASCASYTSSPAPALEVGSKSGACYPNQTCNVGLTCQSGVCNAALGVAADAGADALPKGTPAGELDGACYPNQTCNSGLQCRTGRCIKTVECSANCMCGPDGMCIMPPPPPLQTLGGYCASTAACASNLVCNNTVCSYPESCLQLRTQTSQRATLGVRLGEGRVQPVETYCSFDLPDGPWALVYNSVRKQNGSGSFWAIPYAARLDSKGTPDFNENFYAGSLYASGRIYAEYVSYAMQTKLMFSAKPATFNPETMRFGGSSQLSGLGDLYLMHFASGWSAPDYDGDLDAMRQCALEFQTTQHYGACWAYNLGSDANGGLGAGPTIYTRYLVELKLAPSVTSNPEFTSVDRITRFAKW
jgi:hypothetical protein